MDQHHKTVFMTMKQTFIYVGIIVLFVQVQVQVL